MIAQAVSIIKPQPYRPAVTSARSNGQSNLAFAGSATRRANTSNAIGCGIVLLGALIAAGLYFIFGGNKKKSSGGGTSRDDGYVDPYYGGGWGDDCHHHHGGDYGGSDYGGGDYGGGDGG